MQHMKYTAAVSTLGCKVNQYESSRMIDILKHSGFEMVRSSQPADIYIINTCTVTATADSKSRNAIRRAHRLNPDAKVIVAGCIADYSPDEAAKIPGVSFVLRDEQEARLAEILYELGLCPETPMVLDAGIEGAVESRTRAVLKIQDGCDQFCSYCVIPHVRGAIRSRSLNEVLNEAIKLAENGYKEVVLTGIRLGSYGQERGKKELAVVVEKIAELNQIERIRLSSIEPTDIDDALIEIMAQSSKVCAHLHLPLQSGDDGVLKAMNRPYDSAKYLAITDHIRQQIPEIAFTTDALVGFPGESEEAFQNTCKMAKRVGYARMHVFKFSPRRGTPAAAMENPIDMEIKERRSSELIQLANSLGEDFRRRFLGRTVRVLVEGKERGGLLSGLTDHYIRVNFAGSSRLHGQVVSVLLQDLNEDGVLGVIQE